MKKIRNGQDDESLLQNKINKSDNLKLSAEINALQRSFALFRQDLSKIIRDELLRINKDRFS